MEDKKRTFLKNFGKCTYNSRHKIEFIFAIVVIISIIFAANVTSKLNQGATGSTFEVPGSNVVAAHQLIIDARGFSAQPSILGLINLHNLSATKQKNTVNYVIKVFSNEHYIKKVINPFSFRRGEFISLNNRYALVSAYLGKASGNQSYNTGLSVMRSLSKLKDVTLGGSLIANVELSQQIQHDLELAEIIALPILLLLGIILFQGFYAAILPIITGMVTILITLLVLRLMLLVTPISVYAVNMVIGLGLGLSIDYSLLTTWRYRAEARLGGSIDEVLNRTFQKAGKTAIYSAITVAIAMASLMAFPMPFMFSMGLGGIVSPLVAALVAVTLLPALIGRMAKKITVRRSFGNKRSSPIVKSYFWEKIAFLVTRKAFLSLSMAIVLLAALAWSVGFLRFTGTTYKSLPNGTEAKKAGLILNSNFPNSSNDSFYLAVKAPRNAALKVVAYEKDLLKIKGVTDAVGPEYLSKKIWLISVTTKSGPYSKESENALSAVMQLPTTYKVIAGGSTAEQISQQKHIAQRLPLALAILIIGTILVMIAMTRSLILALLTVLTNTLTIIATLGVMVLIFQDGFLSSLLSFTKQNGLVTTQPFLVCALAFALSTDYGVFLLSRIKESRDAANTTRVAVIDGLSSSGRIITSAAVLFCIAIGIFTFSPVVIIKEIGIGAALAVILDALVVRTLVVPSLMILVGKVLWWPDKLATVSGGSRDISLTVDYAQRSLSDEDIKESIGKELYDSR